MKFPTVVSVSVVDAELASGITKDVGLDDIWIHSPWAIVTDIGLECEDCTFPKLPVAVIETL